MRIAISSILLILFMLASCKNEDVEKVTIITNDTDLSQADKDQIMNTFLATQEAWNEGDIKKFMKGYHQSDDIAFVGASGPTYGYQATLDRYVKTYPDDDAMGKLDFEVLKLYKIDTRTAVLIGKFYLTRTIGDLQGYYTLIWQKIEDKWLIISDHSSGGPVE